MALYLKMGRENARNLGERMARNSTSFKVGNPGGPGRPRGSQNRTTIYKEALDKAVSSEQLVAICVKLRELALAGDRQCIAMILEHKWGRPTQPVDQMTEFSVRGTSAAADELASVFNLADCPACESREPESLLAQPSEEYPDQEDHEADLAPTCS